MVIIINEKHFATSSAYTSSDRLVKTPGLEQETWLQILILILYGVIFLVGVTGNALVLYVVARTPSMQTITNIFIANLSAGDIMMCLLAIPFTPLSAFLNSWQFGDVLCHLLPMALCVSVYVSTLTSTAIAVDRFFVIVHPFRRRMKTVLCLLIIGSIWLISLSISMPLAIYQKVTFTHLCLLLSIYFINVLIKLKNKF